MLQVSETIPDELESRVDAAVVWFNASPESGDDEFAATGIIEAEATLAGSDELKLIMCGGDRCEQRSFRVSGTNDEWNIEFADNVVASEGERPPAELDPPPGVRSTWLEKTLSQHAFVVLLFYRGFW